MTIQSQLVETQDPECLYCNRKSIELFQEDLMKVFPRKDGAETLKY